jgi:glutathione reductase (NADPH)
VSAQTEESLQKRGIDRILAEARFVGPDALAASNRILHAEGFVVATGSHPRRLTFPGANLVKTSDDVLELQEPPKRMAILGAGVVAFEFGQVFARLGTRVTILMRRDRALAGFDQDFIEPVMEFSRQLGVEFLRDVEVHSVGATGNGFRLEVAAEGKASALDADFILNAAGRIAAVDTLDLDKAGVQAGDKGVLVDSYLRSPTNHRVFAGGDAHGARQLSPVASYEGRIIARNFMEGDVEEADYSKIPRAVFTVPPLASVGLTEQEAREAGHATEVAVNDMTNWKVYAIAGETIARAKVVTEKKTGEILGAQLFGSGAAEIIHSFAIAMHAGMTVGQFRHLVFAYPTFSSALESTLP